MGRQSLHIRWVIEANLHARCLSCIDWVTVNPYIQVSKDGQRLCCKECSLPRRRNEVLTLAGPIGYERKLQTAPVNASKHIIRSKSRRDDERPGEELSPAGYDADECVRLLCDSSDFHILYYLFLTLLQNI